MADLIVLIEGQIGLIQRAKYAAMSPLSRQCFSSENGGHNFGVFYLDVGVVNERQRRRRRRRRRRRQRRLPEV